MPAEVKAGLLDLVGRAVERGWPARRAAVTLGLDHARYYHWAARRDGGRLENLPPGGHPLHGLLAWERAAIVELFETWGETDRSHRKLAHRGWRVGLVHVSESTVRRVLGEEGLVLEGPPPREPIPRAPWPRGLEWKPNRVWAYDFTHWTRARRASIALLDVVSRKWLATPTPAEETSTQVEACFLAALDAGDLLTLADERATAALRAAIASGEKDQVPALAGDGPLPLLLAISGNGPQIRSVSTREFLAGVAIAQQFGRPHTPQDQAWIETLFGHVKGEWPHLEKIRGPGEPGAGLGRVRAEYHGVRLHASIGYVTPATNTKAEVMPSASNAATGSRPHARPASHTVGPHPRRTSDHEPPLAGYFTAALAHKVRRTSPPPYHHHPGRPPRHHCRRPAPDDLQAALTKINNASRGVH